MKAWLLIALLFCAGPAGSRAQSPAPTEHRVDSRELDQSITRVLEQREYAWRLPRKETAKEKGWIASWLESVMNGLEWVWKGFLKAWKSLLEWIFGSKWKPPKSSGVPSIPHFDWVVYALGGVAALLLGWAAWRRFRVPRAKEVAAEAVPAVPDLHSEDVSADQLPEDRWLQLARELIEKGDLRLALRAWYLAGLAHLGHRELLRIARHKSNLDYRRELARRASQRRELLGAFEANVADFERVWYGRSEATREVIDRFAGNLEVIRAR